MFTPSGHTEILRHPCTPNKPSDMPHCKPDFCDTDMGWHSCATVGMHEKIHKRYAKDEPCVFPKAAHLVLNFLARDAKTIIADPCCNLDWNQLRSILKKMLVVSMFTGQNKSQHMCDDDNGGKKIW
ncbi:MAG: hypothetical protein AAB323_01860 [Pseudomonadota bacterium]